MPLPHCPLCANTGVPFWQRSNFHLYQSALAPDAPARLAFAMDLNLYFCDECLHVFLHPRPPEDILSQHYEEDYGAYTSPLETQGLTASTNDPSCVYMAEMIREHFSRGVRIVEVGGYDGYVLKQLEPLASEVLLIDGSEAGTAIARRHGIQTRTAFLDRVLAEELAGTFDVVICRHVIEHVPDPSSLLSDLGMLLAEGGLLFVETPDLASMLKNRLMRIVMLEHLHTFSIQSLEKYAKKSGLTAVDIAIPNTLAFVALLQKDTTEAHAYPLRPIDDPNTLRANAHAWAYNIDEHNSKISHIVAEWHKSGKNIWIWGASTAGGSLFGDYYSQDPKQFKGFIDSDPTKYGRRFFAVPNLPIVSPEEAHAQGIDAILIATYAVDEVR